MIADAVIVSRLPRRVFGASPVYLRNVLLKNVWLCVGLLFSAVAVRAEAPPPPREFWDYLMEFGDDQGEVFDPADLAAAAKLPKSGREQGKSTAAETNAAQQKSGDVHPTHSEPETAVTGAATGGVKP